MSRIGNNPISLPSGVNVNTSGTEITVKGPKGELGLDFQGRVEVKVEDNEIHVRRFDDSKKSRAFHGTYQRLITNLVLGVSEGFKKELEVQGVGYRVQMKGKTLVMNLGYSHPVEVNPPAGITLSTPTPTTVAVEGYDKQQVGQLAAELRAKRPPEPYKGKGVRYLGEYVPRKAGKASGKK